MRTRDVLAKTEHESLAPWASRASESGGRLVPEVEHGYRTAFQRDRDRVLHSRAFRRLQYKTQVFVPDEGDHFRNRLTHTLEVAQIARTIGRVLGCNEDLIEAIVLAHDLGHTPFGHAGERAMHRLLAAQGGFEHNRQSLRIVDVLERRSPAWSGLNLTRETRAGILKHGADFPRYPHPVPLPTATRCASVEAQIADLSDEIAYHTHDIDDGLRSGLLEVDELETLAAWRAARERAGVAPEAAAEEARASVTARLIDDLATDLIETSGSALEQSGVASAEDVMAAPAPLVGFSPRVREATRELGRFLLEHLYRHERVAEMASRGERVLADLWAVYAAEPDRVPRLRERAAGSGSSEEPPERAIADYLAGMTDRFALEEHARLFPGGRQGDVRD